MSDLTPVEFEPFSQADLEKLVAGGAPETDITNGFPETRIQDVPPDVGDGMQALAEAVLQQGRVIQPGEEPLLPPRILVPTVEETLALREQQEVDERAALMAAGLMEKSGRSSLPNELSGGLMSRTVSGMTPAHMVVARSMTLKAAALGLAHAPSLHYTEGPARWQWRGPPVRLAWQHRYPNYADCSAFATWCLFQGIHHYNGHDHVNGLNWGGGYTGTLIHHGARVRSGFQHGDLVLYGNPFGATGHVAVYVGGGMVISFGSEPGPFRLSMYYRSDVYGVWRFL